MLVVSLHPTVSQQCRYLYPETSEKQNRKFQLWQNSNTRMNQFLRGSSCLRILRTMSNGGKRASRPTGKVVQQEKFDGYTRKGLKRSIFRIEYIKNPISILMPVRLVFSIIESLVTYYRRPFRAGRSRAARACHPQFASENGILPTCW